MFVKDKNDLLTKNDSISANSTDLMETTEVPINFWKHKEYRREREGGKLMLTSGLSYFVRLIVMITHLHCPKILPCRMLSLAKLPWNRHETGEIFIGSLPRCFYTSIKKKLVLLEVLKKGVKLGELTAYDMDSFCNRTIFAGQKLLAGDSLMLSHELCAYPTSFIDQYVDLRQGTKSFMMTKLAVYITDQPVPDVKIADGNALLYYITWTKDGAVSVIAESMGFAFAQWYDQLSPTTCIVIPENYCVSDCGDRYLDVSLKSQKRSKRMGANTSLVYMSLSPRQHSRYENTSWGAPPTTLSKCSMGEGIKKVTGERYRCIWPWRSWHNNGQLCIETTFKCGENVFVTTDYTDVLIMLVYLMHKKKTTGNIYIKRFDGRFIDVRASTTMLGPKCSQLLGLHSVSGCDTNDYFFRKGKL